MTSTRGDQIRVGVYAGPTGRIIAAPMHVGIEKGYFAELGIDLEVAEPSVHPWYEVATGEIDLGFGYVDYCARDEWKNTFVAVALQEQFVDGKGMSLLLARNDLLESGELTDDCASVAGKKIGLAPNRADDYMLFRGVLDQAGLTFDDVTIAEGARGDGAARDKAIAEGQMDMIIQRRPGLVVRDVAKGYLSVWKTGDELYRNLQARYFVANRDYLKRARDVAVRWLAAYLRGVSDVNEAFEANQNGDSSKLDELARLTTDPPELLRAIKPIGFHPTGAIDPAQLSEELDKMREAGLFPQNYSADEVVDWEFAAEAEAVSAG